MTKNQCRSTPWACVLPIVTLIGLTACGGGGGGGGGATAQSEDDAAAAARAMVIPQEISAVPAASSSQSQSAQLPGSAKLFSRLPRAAKAVADLPATSDYSQAVSRKYVETGALEVFSIIETIMKALRQTNYWDESVIDGDRYAAQISWEESRDGQDTKNVQTWHVQSSYNGNDADSPTGETVLVKVWIPETDDNGNERQVKAEFKLYDQADIDDDGTVHDFGVWDLNVAFDASGSEYFAARASKETVDGTEFAKLTIREHNSRQEQGDTVETDMKAVLYRNDDTGYGKIQVPDFDCDNNGCEMVNKTIAYAYDPDHIYIGIDDTGDGLSNPEDGGNDTKKLLDRNSTVAVTHRYGLFLASNGNNVTRTTNFGFPIRFSDGNGRENWGYYGAFQGEHHLWAWGENGFALSDGGSVNKESWNGGQRTLTPYTVEFQKSLFAKREMQAVDVSSIEGMPLQTFYNRFWNLTYLSAGPDGAGWYDCKGWVNFDQGNNPTCQGPDGAVSFAAFDGGKLVEAAGNNAMIQYEPMGGGGSQVDYSGGDFNVGTPANGDRLMVNVFGRLWLELQGADGSYQWVKKVQRQGAQDWEADFDEQSDAAFVFPSGDDLRGNINGTNYVIKHMRDLDVDADKADAGDYKVFVEAQTVANPTNLATFLPPGTDYLAAPWQKDDPYTWDSALRVLKDGNDTVYTQDTWGLMAWDNNGTPNDTTDDMPLTAAGTAAVTDNFGNPLMFADDMSTVAVQFNYRYAAGGNGQEPAQVYLKDGSGNYALLSDPITLVDVPVVNKDGDAAGTLDLRYDGWMHGLPEMRDAFERGGLASEFLGKVRNIVSGTEAVGVDGTHYYIKALETSVFLDDVSDQVGTTIPFADLPDWQSADALDLDALAPSYVDNGMSGMTQAQLDAAVVKFVEGVAVSSD
jgi:hypothetical protein